MPIHVRISSLVTDAAYPGDDTLKAAVVDYIGSEGTSLAASGLSIGETVYYNRLMCPINETQGVVDYILEISTDGAAWQKANIVLTALQKAVTSPDKVVISR